MKKVIQGCALVLLAGSMMGNQSCDNKETVEARQMRRRVQMKVNSIKAFPITLPDMRTFDFQGVANEQMYSVLSETKTFSTATVDPTKVYDPSGLTEYEAGEFNRCDDNADNIENSSKGMMAQKISYSQNASCLIEMPQAVITGSILDFQLTNGAGVSLSFANLLNSMFGLGAEFNYKRYTLSMTMKAADPLALGNVEVAPGKYRALLAATSQDSYSKEMSGKINLGFNGFGLGASAYYASPLSGVVKDGLTQAAKNLRTSWDNAEKQNPNDANNPWYAMVIRNCDNFIYINAGNGTDAGLVAGDIVRIQNMSYGWDGDFCGSNLVSVQAAQGGPVAYARIVTVGSTVSTAEVLKGNPQYPYSTSQIIHPGARVYMEKMYVAPSKTAKK